MRMSIAWRVVHTTPARREIESARRNKICLLCGMDQGLRRRDALAEERLVENLLVRSRAQALMLPPDGRVRAWFREPVIVGERVETKAKAHDHVELCWSCGVPQHVFIVESRNWHWVHNSPIIQAPLPIGIVNMAGSRAEVGDVQIAQHGDRETILCQNGCLFL